MENELVEYDMKQCNHCGSDFYIVGNRNKYCSNECRKKYFKALQKGPHGAEESGYKTQPKIVHEIKFIDKDAIILKRLVRSAKYRAGLSGLPFNITHTDLKIPEFCPLLGIPFKKTKAGYQYRELVPSIDKIIPELGYVKGNVWIISLRANRIKSDLTQIEAISFCKGLLNKLGELQG